MNRWPPLARTWTRPSSNSPGCDGTDGTSSLILHALLLLETLPIFSQDTSLTA